MKILVGLSGGVDSSVAALLLKQQGHKVIGATMKIWGKDGIKEKLNHNNHKDSESRRRRKESGELSLRGATSACYGPDEIEDIEEARKIASKIGIPYYVFDCAQQYEEIVLKNFKSEYLKGRTPNPCVFCNAYVKFGVLPIMAKEQGIEFDKFATGHYARIENIEGRYYLKRGIAPKKDQSYFLYRLTQEQLKNIVLPLGNYTKDEIRLIAKENGLDVAEKPDSQDFYDGDYNELLNIEDVRGNIVDTKGNILGTHKGIWNYTIGQRKGLGVSSSEPLYVLSLNKDKNEVVVGSIDKTFKKTLTASNLNWLVDEIPTEVQVKIRSTQEPQKALLKKLDNDVEVVFVEYQKSIAIGQSVVFYDNDIVLGGGIIDSVN